jgi:hypothetical protein
MSRSLSLARQGGADVPALIEAGKEQIARRRWEIRGGNDQSPEHAVDDYVVAERVLHRVISEAAYFRWVNRGRPFGDPLTDWLAAEAGILGSLAALEQPSGSVIDGWLRDLSVSDTAYSRWEDRGRPFGDSLADWSAARDEVLAA